LTSPPGTLLVKKQSGRLHSGPGAPSKTVGKGTKRSAKGSKKGQEWCPQWVAITASCDDNDKEVDDSDKEHVATTERDFNYQA
jgi:hypothetical protein